MGSDDADAAAAAPQQPQTQVSTLLRLLLKQQFRKLPTQREVNSTGPDQRQAADSRLTRGQLHLRDQCPLGGKAVLEVEGALVAGHAVEQYLQDATEDALLRLCHRDRLHKRSNSVSDGRLKGRCICRCCIYSSSRTCTIISKVSRIIRLASVARLPSISASCSSSALVLQ